MKLFLNLKQMNDLKSMIEDMITHSNQDIESKVEYIIQLNNIKFELDKPNTSLIEMLNNSNKKMPSLRDIKEIPNSNPFKR